MSPRIFLFACTDDAQAAAHRLEHDLVACFGSDAVFHQARGRAGSRLSVKQIKRHARGSRVVLLLVGPGWRPAGRDAGQIRLAIRGAIDAGNIVLPVLTGQVSTPDASWLEARGLDELASNRARRLRTSHAYGSDLHGLVTDISKHLVMVGAHLAGHGPGPGPLTGHGGPASSDAPPIVPLSPRTSRRTLGSCIRLGFRRTRIPAAVVMTMIFAGFWIFNGYHPLKRLAVGLSGALLYGTPVWIVLAGIIGAGLAIQEKAKGGSRERRCSIIW
jgi:hypothetical protein